jgi:hypothetical protein
MDQGPRLVAITLRWAVGQCSHRGSQEQTARRPSNREDDLRSMRYTKMEGHWLFNLLQLVADFESFASFVLLGIFRCRLVGE